MKRIQLLTENGLLPNEELDIIQTSKEAKKGKNITKAMTLKEAVEYLREFN